MNSTDAAEGSFGDETQPRASSTDDEWVEQRVNSDFPPVVVNTEEEKDESHASAEEEKEEKPPAPKRTLADHSRKEYAFVVAMGFCLAFSAGYSNGACLSGYLVGLGRQSVAGVTGVYTMSAIELTRGDIPAFGFQISTILCVMAGACISALMNPRAVAFEVGPKFGPTFLVASVFYVIGAYDGLHNTKREFFLTAVANGIQNGMSSMYSANLIRTIHLTGTTTDIGLIVGQLICGNRANYWKLWILVGLAVSFWVGSVVGYLATKNISGYSLLFNALFFFLIGCALIAYFVVVHRVSVLQAMFGLGKWGTMFKKIEIRTEEGEELSEAEMLQVFDDLDVDHDGHIEQDELIQALGSNRLATKRSRRSLIGIVHSAFAEHDDDGDWTISRDDWKRLVHCSTRISSIRTTAPGPASVREESIFDIEMGGFRSPAKSYRSP